MSTSNAQSGRAAAVARRKAQVQGKGSQATAAPAVPRRRQRPEPVVETAVEPVATTSTSSQPSRSRRGVNPVVAAETASAAGRNAAKERRQQQKNGKSAAKTANTTQTRRTRAERKPVEPIVEATQERTETIAPAPRTERAANNGRAQVKPQTNQVQSGGRLQSKAYRQAQAKGKAAQDAFKSKGGNQSGAKAKLANPDASSREIAKQVRAERCTRGKTCSTGGTRPTRQQRSSQAAPSKVEESQTLSGQTVSGTMVGQGEKKMTGAETGACQLVSGTEYLGSEEFAKNCDAQPNAQPAKVTQTQTTRGQVVSGTTKVGRGETMTGNEVGTCSAVTGTQYLPADQGQAYCGAEPAKAKMTGFSVMSQPSQSKANKITSGGENRSSQSTTIKPKNPAPAPQKVMPSQTAQGNTTTGTQVGRLEAVTGSDSGACKSVTGTGYQGKEAAAACNVEMPKPAIKVTASATTRGQSVTGDRSGGSIGMTGAEAGDCQAVTGTPYTGVEQSQLCSVDRQNEMKIRQRSGANPSISGVQPGLQGLTGAQKGACQLVSGSHYQGADQTAMVCDSNNAAIPGESDFPQMMGASAQAPVQAQPMAQAIQPAPAAAAMPTAEPAAEQGSKITGDGWDRGSKVTGTEGPWAAQRNSSVRGQSRQAPMGASQFRPQNSEVPMSPITGSSGNTDTGAKVTLSGGARA